MIWSQIPPLKIIISNFPSSIVKTYIASMEQNTPLSCDLKKIWARRSLSFEKRPVTSLKSGGEENSLRRGFSSVTRKLQTPASHGAGSFWAYQVKSLRCKKVASEHLSPDSKGGSRPETQYQWLAGLMQCIKYLLRRLRCSRPIHFSCGAPRTPSLSHNAAAFEVGGKI